MSYSSRNIPYCRKCLLVHGIPKPSLYNGMHIRKLSLWDTRHVLQEHPDFCPAKRAVPCELRYMQNANYLIKNIRINQPKRNICSNTFCLSVCGDPETWATSCDMESRQKREYISTEVQTICLILRWLVDWLIISSFIVHNRYTFYYSIHSKTLPIWHKDWNIVFKKRWRFRQHFWYYPAIERRCTTVFFNSSQPIPMNGWKSYTQRVFEAHEIHPETHPHLHPHPSFLFLMNATITFTLTLIHNTITTLPVFHLQA